MSYEKGCRDCGQKIRMAEINGKWAAYELDGTGFHSCTKANGNGNGNVSTKTMLTLEQVDTRLKKLEKSFEAFLYAMASAAGEPNL